MKDCPACECRIPDSARLCPHCRRRQLRVEGVPQTVLGSVVVAITTLMVIDACPAAAAMPVPADLLPPAISADTTTRPLPTIARLRYEGGGDWYANPSSLDNLLEEIRRRTGIPVADGPAEVAASDPDLADHPYLYATGHGNISFTEREIVRLREYLRGGGFLHVDDNYGLDESFRREVARLFPDEPLTEVPIEHPIYRIYYDLPDGLPKIHEHDGKPAQGFGIFIDGRLALYYSYESDLGDGWEDAAVHGDPDGVREQAFQMGVNLFLYAISATSEP